MLKPTKLTLWEMTGYSDGVVLIGAGGKTTTLQALAEEIDAQGKRVIGTTTTKVYPVKSSFWNGYKNPDAPSSLEIKSPCFWYKDKIENKWLGPSLEKVDLAMKDRVQYKINWVIEGDGAREKQLKCWNHHEPQIPSQSQCAILLISGDLWGKILTEKEIHRPEKCPELLGRPWTPERATEYILNSPVFKADYQKLSWVVLFNTFEKANEVSDKIEETIHGILKIKENGLQDTKNRTKPKHLRFAEGDVKKGILECYDLW